MNNKKNVKKWKVMVRVGPMHKEAKQPLGPPKRAINTAVEMELFHN